MVRQYGFQPRKTTQRGYSSISLAPRSRQLAFSSVPLQKSPLIISTAPNLTAPKQTRKVRHRHLHSPHYTFRLSDKSPSAGRPTPYDVPHVSHNLYDDDGNLDVQDHSDEDPNWDEETTLIALLDDHDHPEHDDKTTLVDRLGPAFAAHPQVRNGYYKQTFIPVIQRAKQVHDAIDQDILIRRFQGLSLFDENSRHFEDTARREYDAKSLEALFVNLEDLIGESDVLFQDFKARMDKYVHHLRQCADQVPGDVERLISKLDKKANQLGVEDHAKAKEKFLRGILEKY
ncbi:hypothetical protein PAXINDRAFT_182021 [Paxillus involutus ATCC 200175]|uniref:Uncharacterized protein n=1 Tax=Paxillus involutus ATCC 200175 TaxID=664439 RepID=A0A0C9SRI5_PAXIN|nr:hypothetical protein PAXINDRAFT_182021 [Paxillus involutus ATCC 200175]